MATLATIPKYESYKDSGVDWLGGIPRNWVVIPAKRRHRVIKQINKRHLFHNVLSLTLRGVVNNNKDNPEGLVPRDYANYQLFEKENLVFKLIDLENLKTSRVGIVHEQGIMSPAYIRLEICESFYPRYAYYYFYDLYLNAVYNNLGEGVRSTLGPNDLLEIPIVEPTFKEQKAISYFLDKKIIQIDEAIAIKEKQIILLKERKQIIIQKAVTQGLNPNVPMKDSGVDWIGKIPEHWDVKKLKYIVNFIGGGTPSKENQRFWDGDICWVSPKDMKRKFISNSIDKITELAVSKSSVKLVPKNTVLIVVRGMILAKKIPVAVAMKPLTINQDMKGLIVSPICHSNFLMNLLDGLHEELSTILEESGHGTKTMPTEKLGNFKLPLPPQSEQKTIIEYIEKTSGKYDTSIQLQRQQIEKLKEYKATLINSAVTGKIKIEGYGHDA